MGVFALIKKGKNKEYYCVIVKINMIEKKEEGLIE